MSLVTKKYYPTLVYSENTNNWNSSSSGMYSVGIYDNLDRLSKFVYFDIEDLKGKNIQSVTIKILNSRNSKYGGKISCMPLSTNLKENYEKKVIPDHGVASNKIEFTCDSTSVELFVKDVTYDFLKNGLEFVSTSTNFIGILYFKTDGSENDTSYAEISYDDGNIEVEDFSVSGDSIDGNISVNWVCNEQESFTLQATLNGIIKSYKTGTTEKSVIFEKGEISVGGNYTFKLIVTNQYGSTKEYTVTKQLSYTQASISLLELPSSTINIDESFTIRWISSNQSSFKIELDGKTYTGTTQTSITIPKGTIGKGTKTVKLTVTYDSGYYSNSATKSSSFVGYGAPNAPYLTIKSTYNSATPSLTWASDEQVAYQVVIKRALTVIEDSGQVVSNNKYYITKTLENNATYTISVKVRNKYGLWSTESKEQFTIQFSVPNTPIISSVADITTGSIILTVNTDTTGDTEYKNTEIWKREHGGDWKRMSYNLNVNDVWQDFYVAGSTNYDYKARNIGQSGGISESEIITASTIVNGYNFYDVEDNSNFLRFTCGDAPKPKINQSIVSNLFAGAEAPTNFSDGVLYWTCSLSFKTDNREDIFKLVSLMKSKLLLYKDNKGHKWFGNITNSPSFPEDDVDDITIDIEFTQSQFTEEDVYCGDNLTLIRWNGGWKFDGTHTFGGE